MEKLSDWLKLSLRDYCETAEYEKIVGLIESIENSHPTIFTEREEDLSDRMAGRLAYIFSLLLDIHDFEIK